MIERTEMDIESPFDVGLDVATRPLPQTNKLSRNIPDYLVRLYVEFSDIDNQRDKLSDFIGQLDFEALAPEEKATLLYLRTLFSRYRDVLRTRIDNATTKENVSCEDCSTLRQSACNVVVAEIKRRRNSFYGNRLVEYEELSHRYDKLMAFTATDGWLKLSSDEKTNLKLQLILMDQILATEKKLLDYFSAANYIPGIGKVDPTRDCICDTDTPAIDEKTAEV